MRRSSPELVIRPRRDGQSLSAWLYEEVRSAILSGRLRRGSPLPPSRDLAASYRVSRGTVVRVYEQLQDEGYLEAVVGRGTIVSSRLPEDFLPPSKRTRRPAEKALTRERDLPQPYRRPVLPFRPIEPALDHFPLELWARVSARTYRTASTALLAGGEGAGLKALRVAIAAHVAESRAVVCSAEQVIVTTGTQHSLSLLARLLLEPGDPVWMEDPGYSGALQIFRDARAVVIPVRVDTQGLDPHEGWRRCPQPKAAYLTPAHQFPLGVALSLERKLQLLSWAEREGVALIEDDYDSEFRFSGKPTPAMMGLREHPSTFLLGTFNKTMFPALRLGYIIAPERWVDALIRLRFRLERHPPGLSQAAMAAFLEGGHYEQHLRRMRQLYGSRLECLQNAVRRHLEGVLEIHPMQAGLSTSATLLSSVPVPRLVEPGRKRELEIWPVHDSLIEREDLNAMMLGFAAFSEKELRQAVIALARVIEETVGMPQALPVVPAPRRRSPDPSTQSKPTR